MTQSCTSTRAFNQFLMASIANLQSSFKSERSLAIHADVKIEWNVNVLTFQIFIELKK